MQEMQDPPQGLGGGLDRPIFYGSVIIIVSLCLPLALYPQQQQGQQILGQAFDYLTHNFGILYLMGSVATLLFLLYLAFSRYGEIRLGSSRPDFSTLVGRQCCFAAVLVPVFCIGARWNGRTTTKVLLRCRTRIP